MPAAVRSVAAGRALRQVWVNEVGGRTFEVGRGSGRCFVKWTPAGSPVDLAAEAARMNWARQFHPVPEPLDQGSDGAGSWLVTAALPGGSAVSGRWLAEPATAVTALGAGLRALHEALPVPDCPFSWAAQDRVADAHRQAADGRLQPSGTWPESHQPPLSVAAALDLAAAIPPIDRLVVCHGDACAPNTLLTPDGRWCGHVDLGLLGTADRWADLAVATWSTEWNYGPGWERRLLDAYGIQPDADRTRYYRLLWELSSLSAAERNSRADDVSARSAGKSMGPVRRSTGGGWTSSMSGTEPGGQPTPLELTFPADPAQLAHVRAALRSWLSRCGLSRRAATDVLTAAGEACANAIEHGLRNASGQIRLTAEVSVTRLRLTISDTGRWQPGQRRGEPYRGYGLRLMRTLMHRVDIHRTPDGTTVEMQRKIG